MTPSANPYGWLAIGFLLQLALCTVLLLAAWAVVPTPVPPMSEAALPAPGTPELTQMVDAGGRIAVTFCVACHSATADRPFAGGVPLATPFGRIYSSNISPDAVAGIGGYTLADFDRAVRHGIARDGQTLRPVMPYATYARFSDADMTALYAFLMHGVAAASDANRPADIVWPLSMRWPFALWRKAGMPVLDAQQAETSAAR